MNKESQAATVINPYSLYPMELTALSVVGFVQGIKSAFQKQAVPTAKEILSVAAFPAAFYMASMYPQDFANHNAMNEAFESGRNSGVKVGTAIKACFKIS